MKKIKIEDSYKISRPFKVLLGFIVACVVLVFFIFVGSEAKHASFVIKPWEPTVTTNAKVTRAVYETYRRAPSDYLISYTYTADGKSYDDSDTIRVKDYMQQPTVEVVYKQADPSVNKLALGIDNALSLVGAAIVFTGVLAGTAFIAAYYFMNWRPKHPERLRKICTGVITVGATVMLVSILL